MALAWSPRYPCCLSAECSSEICIWSDHSGCSCGIKCTQPWHRVAILSSNHRNSYHQPNQPTSNHKVRCWRPAACHGFTTPLPIDLGVRLVSQPANGLDWRANWTPGGVKRANAYQYQNVYCINMKFQCVFKSNTKQYVHCIFVYHSLRFMLRLRYRQYHIYTQT